MVYYGRPRVKDPRNNAEDFGKGGFTPGWFWGTIVLLVEFVEFVGGISVVVGFYTWVAAALIGIEMLTGTVWKIAKAHTPFTDWSTPPRPRRGAPVLPERPEIARVAHPHVPHRRSSTSGHRV